MAARSLAAEQALASVPSPKKPAFNPDEAVATTNAGADIIVAHMGVTTGGSIGATSAKSLDDCVDEIDAISAAARSVRSDIIVICHGGPISTPADAEYVLQHANRWHGFYGASSAERLPAETAIRQQIEAFKAITGHSVGASI